MRTGGTSAGGCITSKWIVHLLCQKENSTFDFSSFILGSAKGNRPTISKKVKFNTKSLKRTPPNGVEKHVMRCLTHYAEHAQVCLVLPKSPSTLPGAKPLNGGHRITL